MRAAIVVAVACLSVVGLCAGQDVKASIKKSTNIPAQELVPALKTLARERGFQVVFRSEVVGAKRTQGAVGEFTTAEALTKLLEGTNLGYSYLDEKTVTITPVGAAAESTAADSNEGDQKKFFWDRFRVAQVDQGTTSPNSSSSPSSHDNGGEASSAVKLEEIIVTAQKRSESLSKTALAVSALSANDLQSTGVVSLANLTSAAPNVEIRTIGLDNSVAVTIRGVTNADFNHSGDPAVATYFDGVYIGRTQGLIGALYDIERVEILRGPQGTLYGRNATGGNINVITADPKQLFDAAVDLSYGNYNDAQVHGMLNVPVANDLAIRLAVVTHRNDGYFDTRGTTTRSYEAADDLGGRVTALWTPGEHFSWRLSVDDFLSNGSPGLDISTGSDGKPVDGFPVFNRPVPSYPEPKNHIDNLMVRSRMNLQLSEPWSVAYIAGYQHIIYEDWFATSDGVLAGLRDDGATSESHELNVSYVTQKVKNIFGANYFHMDTPVAQDSLLFGTNYGNHDLVISNAWGVFDQATLSVTDLWRLTGGVRYSSESKFIDGLALSFCPESIYGIEPFSVIHQTVENALTSGIIPPGCGYIKQGPTEGKWSNVSWKGGVEHDLSSGTLGYFTVTTGFKSGGVNAGLISNTFKPENVTNYELGMRSRLFDNRLQLSANLFYEDYKDIQVSQLNATGTAQITSNAAAATIKGIETEWQWHVSDKDRLSGFLNYLSAKYDKYENAIDQQFSTIYPSISGNSLPFAPKLSARLQYSHEFTLTNGQTLTPTVSGYYQTKNYLREFDFPVDRVSGYGKIDLNLQYADTSGHWLATAYAFNVTNRVIRSGSYTLGGAYYSDYDAPRTYGVRLSYKY